jgi:hypothetical protein
MMKNYLKSAALGIGLALLWMGARAGFRRWREHRSDARARAETARQGLVAPATPLSFRDEAPTSALAPAGVGVTPVKFQSLPPRETYAWRPEDYRVIPNAHAGFLALRKGRVQLWAPFEDLSRYECAHDRQLTCLRFPNGQEVIESVPVRQLLPQRLTFRLEDLQRKPRARTP